jgi:hypothetical protein
MFVIVAKRGSEKEYLLRIDQPGHTQKHQFTIADNALLNNDGWFTTSIITPQLQVRILIKEDIIHVNSLDFVDTKRYIFELHNMDDWFQPILQ